MSEEESYVEVEREEGDGGLKERRKEGSRQDNHSVGSSEEGILGEFAEVERNLAASQRRAEVAKQEPVIKEMSANSEPAVDSGEKAPVDVAQEPLDVGSVREVTREQGLENYFAGFETVGELGIGSSARVLHIRQGSIGIDYALHTPREEDLSLNTRRIRKKAETITRLREDFPENFPRVIADNTYQSGNSGVIYELVPHEFLGFLEGKSLEERVGGFVQLAEVIKRMHSKGLVGLDVKPSMARFDGEGKLKLVDIEERYRLDVGSEVSIMQSMDLTTSISSPLGTLGYLAPEQHTPSGEVDARADVFGLGKVLYEVVRGEPAVTGVPANTREFDSKEGGNLYDIVLRAINSERDRRFESVDDMVSAVRNVFYVPEEAKDEEAAKTHEARYKVTDRRASALEKTAESVEPTFGEASRETLGIVGRTIKTTGQVVGALLLVAGYVAYKVGHAYPGAMLFAPTMIRKAHNFDRERSSGPGPMTTGFFSGASTLFTLGNTPSEYHAPIWGTLAATNAVSLGYEFCRKGYLNAKEKKNKIKS